MRRVLATLLVLLLAGIAATPAQAVDNTWITNPSLSAVTLGGTNIVSVGTGFNLSTQANGFSFKYAGAPSQAGRFAQINIFDVAGGVTINLAANVSGSSSVACDPQVLSSDTHTCFFRLDGNAKAEIPVTLSKVSAQAAFKFKILAGPNIQESAISQVNFVSPTNTIAAVAKSVRGPRGGAAIVQFKVTQGNIASPNIRVSVSFTGVGAYLSATSALSDSDGLVTVYLSDLKRAKGKAVISAQIDGGTSAGTSTITWK
ncbi:MAG: hypothetical protein ACKOWK_06875 [Micrococcales bacterium]